MPTAFVTGGSGFVGGRLIESLTRDGWRVRALARSDRATGCVRGRGAEAVSGDLFDLDALTAGAKGADVCFHAAADVSAWGPWERFRRTNVDGTRRVAEACREGGTGRLVYVGTEAAVWNGQPLVRADERVPLAFGSRSPYSSTKALAEQAVLAAGRRGLDVVVVRPRFVWGPGDSTLLPAFAEAARTGRLRWIGGGAHLTSTTHVDNTVHGLRLAAERGARGGVYYITDGAPVQFRTFVTQLLETQGIAAPDGELSIGAARAIAAAGEWAWRALPLPGAPPLTRLALWLSAVECTLDDSRARSELGYRPVVGREEGLRELAGSDPGAGRSQRAA